MDRIARWTLAVTAVALLMAGCAAGGTGDTGSGSDRITPDELGSVDVASLYEVVQRLRPRWLEVRGVRGFETQSVVGVFMDRTYLGGVDELRSLGPEVAASLRYLSGPQAQAELRAPSGVNLAGAIVINSVDQQRR